MNLIDDITRHYHDSLDIDDICFYFGEYTADKGYSYSDCNNLILNLKKPPSRKDKTTEYQHKLSAIRDAVALLTPHLGNNFTSNTIVPVPSSKALGHPDHDDRLMQILVQCNVACQSKLDVRELVINTTTHKSSHTSDSGERPSIEYLRGIYKVDPEKALPLPKCILVFDDMITRGNHYKAMVGTLLDFYAKEHRHTPQFCGLFISRRVWDYGFNTLDNN